MFYLNYLKNCAKYFQNEDIKLKKISSFNRAMCSILEAQKSFNDFFIVNLFTPFVELAWTFCHKPNQGRDEQQLSQSQFSISKIHSLILALNYSNSSQGKKRKHHPHQINNYL